MHPIFASIITIGDELLIGQVIDTNSAFIAQQLNSIGIAVRHRVAVGDQWDEIWQTLEQESRLASVVLITGGLGPTADDITKPLLCEYFEGKMVVDAGALSNVESIFARLNRPMIDRNRKQAEVPDTCIVIPNRRGTAPGMWFEKNQVFTVSMPGVPHEMKGMMEEWVIPRLQAEMALPVIIHQTLLTYGVGESFLADLIQTWEEALPPHIKLAYLPNYGMVRLRLSASGESREKIEREVQTQFVQLQELVKDFLVTIKDEPMEAVVARLLLAKKQTLGTAESCTGGYISHIITAMAGSSAYFKGAIVSYSNEVKTSVLGVDSLILSEKGAVSEDVVIRMLAGALDCLQTTYAIAVSGIMGPGGGTEEKPVGMVWIAVGNGSQTITQQFHFRFDRKRNIELTATNALNMLRKLILSQP